MQEFKLKKYFKNIMKKCGEVNYNNVAINSFGILTNFLIDRMQIKDDNHVSHQCSPENIGRLEFHHVHVEYCKVIVYRAERDLLMFSRCVAYTSLHHSQIRNEIYTFDDHTAKKKQQLRHLFTNIAAIEIRNANLYASVIYK